VPRQEWYRYEGDNLLRDLFNTVRSLGYSIIAPIKKNNSHILSQVQDHSQIVLDYVRTLNSPKHFLYPNKKPLITWSLQDNILEATSPPLKPVKIAFIGIKPCDSNSICVLDKLLLDKPADPYYKLMRENTLIIVYDCTRSDEYCFCELTKSRIPYPECYDLWIVERDNAYYINVASKKGYSIASRLDIVPSHKPILNINSTTSSEFQKIIEQLEKLYESAKWSKCSEKCLLCGGCTSICPTCICFDIVDHINQDLRSGSRLRVWTSCILRSFTIVAGGRVVRKSIDERFKFRYYHKFVFARKRYGLYFCTGCGRCSSQCPANINMVEVIKRVVRA